MTAGGGPISTLSRPCNGGWVRSPAGSGLTSGAARHPKPRRAAIPPEQDRRPSSAGALPGNQLGARPNVLVFSAVRWWSGTGDPCLALAALSPSPSRNGHAARAMSSNAAAAKAASNGQPLGSELGFAESKAEFRAVETVTRLLGLPRGLRSGNRLEWVRGPVSGGGPLRLGAAAMLADSHTDPD